jgi:phosphoserine phosphatase
MRTAFCFNLDCTVTTTELLPCIGSELGISDEIAALTKATMNGHIPFEQSLKLVCLLLGEIPTDKVSEIVSNVSLDEEIVGFIQSRKEDCFVLTAKPAIWVNPIAGRCGCEVFSSKGVMDGNKLRLSRILDKGNAVSVVRGRGYERIVAIGNSSNDVPMLESADVRIVFGGYFVPSQSAITEAEYIIYERSSLCRMLRAL